MIHADEPGYPAFYRLVWNDHVKEFSHLEAADRMHCVEALVAMEKVMLEHLRPAKINVASLGNVVPHLHWHVIARFEWDPAWPQAVWTSAQRVPDAAVGKRVERFRTDVEEALRKALEALENRAGS